MNLVSGAGYYFLEFLKDFKKPVIERNKSSKYSRDAGNISCGNSLGYQKDPSNQKTRSFDCLRGKTIRSCGELKIGAAAIETCGSFADVLRNESHLKVERWLLPGATGSARQVVKAMFGKDIPDTVLA